MVANIVDDNPIKVVSIVDILVGLFTTEEVP